MEAFAVAALFACQSEKKPTTTSDFIRIENGQFIRNGEPYYYVGANFWYGAILASEGYMIQQRWVFAPQKSK